MGSNSQRASLCLCYVSNRKNKYANLHVNTHERNTNMLFNRQTERIQEWQQTWPCASPILPWQGKVRSHSGNELISHHRRLYLLPGWESVAGEECHWQVCCSWIISFLAQICHNHQKKDTGRRCNSNFLSGGRAPCTITTHVTAGATNWIARCPCDWWVN